MSSKRIHKFPELSPDYSGPRLHAIDVADPADPTKFKTRHSLPETVIHFELLAPTQSVTSGLALKVPMLPLNFKLRNFYLTFTDAQGVPDLETSLANILTQLGIVYSHAYQLSIFINACFRNGIPQNKDGGWGGYDKPPPSRQQAPSLIALIIFDWLKSIGIHHISNSTIEQVSNLVAGSINLARITGTFASESALYASWEEEILEFGNFNVEAQVEDYDVHHSTEHTLTISRFETIPVNNGFTLKGLTIWMVGSFVYPFNPSRSNIGL
jgi:hypothetical protein